MNPHWIPLAIVLPLVASVVLAAAGRHLPRAAVELTAIAVAAATTLLCAALTWHVLATDRPLVYWFGDWLPRGKQVVGIGLVVDPLGAATAAFSAAMMTAALAFSWHYLDTVRALYHVLMLVFLAAMVGFCLTADLFNLFVFFELMSVSAYALTGYKIESQSSLEGSINFAVVNTLGAYLLLIGVGLLYARTGALNLAQIGESLAVAPADRLVVAAATLILTAFLIKGAIVPFHFWLPDAHAVAPTPVCVLFSGIMVELGLFGAARVYWVGLSGALVPHADRVRIVLIGAGIFTAIVGALLALWQRHIKRLLAFSTVSHAGMMLIGIGLLSADGLGATLVYVAGHGLVKGSLFMLAGILLNRRGSIDQCELLGQGRHERWLGAAFFVGGLALVGLPPFGTWLGKAALEEAAATAGFAWLKWIWLAAAVLTGVAVLRAFGRVFLGLGATTDDTDSPSEREAPESREARVVPSVTLCIAATLLILAALVGLVPRLTATAVHSARDWVDRPRYVALIYGQTPLPRAGPIAHHPPAWSSVGVGLAAVAVAMLIARVSLSARGGRLLSRRPLRGVKRALNAVHSGYVGDYIAWLMIGLTVLGAALATAVR
ncbi:MAG TPA: proton-conducting transporter membrane subunit [Pirellulales bacterium]|jgi:multicomponent Na+:H+ antiporter subunit D|nr:proton-conducting transporter membrane subunit [Pirellulales bacterium]